MLSEGKRNRGQVQQTSATSTQPLTQFVMSRMFAETSEQHFVNEAVKESFKNFLETKKHDAMTPYGSRDRPLTAGPLQGILHAGLTLDIRVFYEIRGRKPHTVYLYFIATHDESGTAGGKGFNIQKSWAKRIKRAKRDEFNIESQDPTQE
jgi:hypothetical protein